MLGDLITRSLLLILGYAYPALECFKTMEKNKIDIEELRFWCQYWIIVAALTVCERIGDVFVSWLPMYGEAKLAFIIYLWYPKTKGSSYIYDSLLRPYVTKHETDIERKLQELRARAWDFAIYYWENCTNLGQTAFFQVLQYFVAQSEKPSSNSQKGNDYAPSAPPVPPPSVLPSLYNNNKWAPKSPSGYNNTVHRAVADSLQSNRIQAHLDYLTETARGVDTSEADDNDKLQQVHMRHRRSRP